MSILGIASDDRCCVCGKRAMGPSVGGHPLCADHHEWYEGEAAEIAAEMNPPRLKRKYTKPHTRKYEERGCEEPGCSARYTPIAPRSPFCPEHSDARLRARKEWAHLEERQQRRADARELLEERRRDDLLAARRVG